MLDSMGQWLKISHVKIYVYCKHKIESEYVFKLIFEAIGFKVKKL